ncbi:AI-2E family transporter [Ornithinimicrobium pratense]|uniref:AI-2E family transporter n=1 Tax=Ornithinimicrobium pratense TaxID=2593973 RepID=A0A5J6V4W9_9MICO|nr:AI-2E family transporter [Ornithinimicrobium pratense]QFG68637.1 AI-2E family transporter [Ornithinimicrobium pratense]
MSEKTSTGEQERRRIDEEEIGGREVVPSPVEVEGPGPHPTYDGSGVDRGSLLLAGLKGAANWSWRLLLVLAALAVLLWLVGQLWVGVLPVLMAILISTILWPVSTWLKAHGWPSALAALTVLIGSLAAVVGVFVAIAPTVIEQGQIIIQQAGEGLQVMLEWLSGPPLNLQNEQVTDYVDQASTWLQEQSNQIAGGVISGAMTVGSILVTIVMTLVFTFFILKDGQRFGPWVRRVAGPTAGMHLTEGFARIWKTVGGFFKAQAAVSAVDAIFIGLGLLLLGVPMAFVLAIITFFAGFIPIVGAFTAGSLAVLVALVSEGFTTAIWVLVIVLAVQQIEGNVLQPVLQSKAMDLHPALILLVVAAGATRFGIVGAFLAVPVTAAFVSVIRYGSEHLDLRTGTVRAEELKILTSEGRAAAVMAERTAPVFQLRAQQAFEQAEGERGAARVFAQPGAALATSLRDKLLAPIRRRGDSDDEVSEGKVSAGEVAEQTRVAGADGGAHLAPPSDVLERQKNEVRHHREQVEGQPQKEPGATRAAKPPNSKAPSDHPGDDAETPR